MYPLKPHNIYLCIDPHSIVKCSYICSYVIIHLLLIQFGNETSATLSLSHPFWLPTCGKSIINKICVIKASQHIALH